jgi:hypothetical protein
MHKIKEILEAAMAREILELKEHVDHVLKVKARELVDEKNLEITENFFYEPEGEVEDDEISEISSSKKRAYIDAATKSREELYKKASQEYVKGGKKLSRKHYNKSDEYKAKADKRDDYILKAKRDVGYNWEEAEKKSELSEMDRQQGGILHRYLQKNRDPSEHGAKYTPKRKAGRELARKKRWGDKKYGFTEPRVKAVERNNEETELSEDDWRKKKMAGKADDWYSPPAKINPMTKKQLNTAAKLQAKDLMKKKKEGTLDKYLGKKD